MILMVKEKQNEEVDGSSPEQDVEEQNEKSWEIPRKNLENKMKNTISSYPPRFITIRLPFFRAARIVVAWPVRAYPRRLSFVVKAWWEKIVTFGFILHLLPRLLNIFIYVPKISDLQIYPFQIGSSLFNCKDQTFHNYTNGSLNFWKYTIRLLTFQIVEIASYFSLKLSIIHSKPNQM